MDSELVIDSIRRHRQAFAFGIHGLQTLYIGGPEEPGTLRVLKTNVVDGIPLSGWTLPNRLQRNAPSDEPRKINLLCNLSLE